MALTLCIGFVVDDTIVMLENIGRHMEMGKPAMRAAFDGAKEVEFTIIAMTVSLVAVFIPVLFMGGIVGRLLQEFAVTIGVAILVSCFVSISLTPMLCSRFLKTAHGKKHGRLYNFTERMFDGSLRAYDVTLQFALRHRAVTMALSFLFIAGAAYLFMIVPKGFLPTEDQGRFNVSVEAIQGIGFEEMVRHQQEVAAILAQGSRHRRVPAAAWARAAATGRRELVESGPHQRRPEAAQPNGRDRSIRSWPSLRPKLCAGAGRPRVHGQPAAHQPWRHGWRALVIPVHAAGSRYRRALSRGPGARRGDAKHREHRGRQQRSPVEQPAGANQPESRPNRRAGIDRESGGNGAVQRLRHAAGFADLRGEQPVPGHSAGRAGVPAGSRGALDAVRAIDQRQAHPAQHRCDGDDRRRAAVGQPYRPASIGEPDVQPQTWLRARRRGERHRGSRQRPRCRRRSPRNSRARRRRFRSRCRASGSCS